jgi:Na+-transporting methylmalonyl-CoA/oxaloacetate decarboxylase gamma subunit
MDPLVEGLRISVIGLSLVFLALGMLIVLLVVLGRISDRLLATQSSEAAPVAVAEEIIGTGDADQSESEDLARVAAIAVALLGAQRVGVRDESLGRLLQQAGW